ncbi:MAG: hypothetical protein WCV56_01680 [Candidatus Omnitrophota bacterium]
MILRIMGVIMMLFGSVGLISPRMFKARLQRRMNFRVKFIVYGFILIFAVFILISVVKVQGMLSKIAGLAGLVITIKIVMLVTSKSSERLSMWFEKRPPIFFRLLAFIVFVMGLMLFFA